MTPNWNDLSQRIHQNEMDRPSALRRDFFRLLKSQHLTTPAPGHKQTKKMAFLRGPVGKRLLWDLSATGQLIFWVSKSRFNASKTAITPDLIKPWTPDKGGRHSHLNQREAFYGEDACKFSCESIGEAKHILAELGFTN